MSLRGKRVLLTGGAGAIGALVARRLLAQRATVTVIDRVSSLSFDAECWSGDLASPAGIAELAAKAAHLKPDMLINLAGVQHFGPFEEQSSEQIYAHYMVNLVAPALLTRAVLPGMKQKGAGHIVNIGSIFGSINYAHFVGYSSAKAGLRGLSEGLRRELRYSGIAVTYIAPRAIRAGLSSSVVMRFAQLTDMNMDEPATAADAIVAAIIARRKDVYIGFPERWFVSLNAVLPRLVDAAVAGNDRKAKTLFPANRIGD